jgi:hypothetical protein
VLIRVHPRPKKFGVCRGALLRARREFGVKGDKALFLILGTRNFGHFLIRVHLCLSGPIRFFYCFHDQNMLKWGRLRAEPRSGSFSRFRLLPK